MTASDPLPLVVVLNSNKAIEYHRDRPLTEKQVEDLDLADVKLQSGIQLGEQFIKHPTDSDKALFMSHQLVVALENNRESIIALSCAYIATRYPDIQQIRASTSDGQVSIQLINDEAYVESTPLTFTSRKDLS